VPKRKDPKLKKPTVEPSDLPSSCRTWDRRRHAWQPKVRYATEAEAKAALGRDKTKSAYRCKAAAVGEHFHLGSGR